MTTDTKTIKASGDPKNVLPHSKKVVDLMAPIFNAEKGKEEGGVGIQSSEARRKSINEALLDIVLDASDDIMSSPPPTRPAATGVYQEGSNSSSGMPNIATYI